MKKLIFDLFLTGISTTLTAALGDNISPLLREQNYLRRRILCVGSRRRDIMMAYDRLNWLSSLVHACIYAYEASIFWMRRTMFQKSFKSNHEISLAFMKLYIIN